MSAPSKDHQAGLPERHRLGNGLTVVLKEQRGSPVVAFQAWVGVGSADEPDELAGIAHVFEHMLFKGTARRGVGRIAQEVESAGGDINAWTSFDQTVYHLVLASRYFDTGLDIITDALRNSSFDAGELERELKVVLEEVKQGEDNPGRVVTQALFSTAFTRHPYRRPVIGYSRTVERFRRRMLLDFFRRYYVPNNITLVVVGDFDAHQAERKIAAAWQGARARPLPASGPPPEPAQRRTRVVVNAGDVSEVHLVGGFHIPRMQHPDTGALDAAAILLGQGDSSRYQLEIKRRRQLVSDAYAYSFTPRYPGLLVLGATLPPKDLEEALVALLDEATRLAREEVGHEELEKAKTIIESDSTYQKETVQGMARKLGFFETVAGSLSYEDDYLRQTRELTPRTLRAVVDRYLRPENLTVSALLPADMARGAEKKIGARLLERVGRSRIARARHEEPQPTAGAMVATTEPRQEVIREVLPSGMRVLILPDRSVPLVAVRAAWLGGIRDEDPQNNGVNNLIAALVTRGTKSRTGEQIAHEIESLAGLIGGFSGRNSFGVRVELLSRHVDEGLDVFADCLLHPAFAEEEIEKERRQVLEEIRTQEDNVSSVVFRLFGQTLYRRHPYRMDLLGTGELVTGLGRRRLIEYYREHFSPSRMVVAVVGDVDPAATLESLRAAFGSSAETVFSRSRRAPVALSAPAAEEEVVEPRRAERLLNKQQAHLVVGFPATTIADPDRFGLEVLSTILSGQGGRLFVELREKKGLAYRVSAFALEGIDPGYFAFYVATSPENLATVEAGILAEIDKITGRPVSRAELERAKRYLMGSHDISLQRRSALAATLAFNECYGLGWDQYRRYAPGIQSVTAAEVQRIARKYLDPRRSVTAVVRPEEAAAAAKEPAAEVAARGAVRNGGRRDGSARKG